MEGFKPIMKMFLLMVLTNALIQQAAASTQDAESFFYYQQSDYPKDCSDILTKCDSEGVKNGVYYIKPEGVQDPIEVYCDLIDGGWTVIQRREDGTIDFARNLTYYADGFGFLHKEFWMGGTNLAYLVNQKKYKLKIEMTDGSGNNHSVVYNWFRISDEKSRFQLVKLEDYSRISGSPGADQMSAQSDGEFHSSGDDCSGRIGWWFNSGCAGANLNGIYRGSVASTKLTWGNKDIRRTTMKVLPQDYTQS